MADRRIFSEPPVAIMIDDPQKLTQLVAELPAYAKGKWKHIHSLYFQYDDKATVFIPHTEDSWRKTYIEFGDMSTVKPIGKEYLLKPEIDEVLDRFFENVLDPYCKDHPDLVVKRWGKNDDEVLQSQR